MNGPCTRRATPLPANGPGILSHRHYRLTREIGRGGFSAVYEAREIVEDPAGDPGGLVAVKVYHERAASRTRTRNFEIECKALQSITSAYVVRLLDAGWDGERIGWSHRAGFLVMERLEGEVLGDRIAREVRWTPDSARRLLMQICLGTEAIHKAGFVHRDLKPDNVYVGNREGTRTGEEKATIFDFSISRDRSDEAQREYEQENDLVLGTALYMAPEQIRREDLDERTDIYTLGLMLFELLTAKLPFMADTVDDVAYLHLTSPPPIPSWMRPELRIPEEMDDIVLRALRKDPAGRFQRADELGEALDDPVRWARLHGTRRM